MYVYSTSVYVLKDMCRAFMIAEGVGEAWADKGTGL